MLRPGRYSILEYLRENGENPFRLWLTELDGSTRAKIQARILRFESGNFGDFKSLAKGVYEARIMFGPGYRVYFGIEKGQIVLLLIGGDKSTQAADIRLAQSFWESFKGTSDGK